MKNNQLQILSTAKIGLKAMIPAISLANNRKVVAIASRTLSNAQDVAQNFEIERAYVSYEATSDSGV